MRRRSTSLALGLCLGLLTGCSNDETTNIVGLDCGLVRFDLTGDWVVDFALGTRTLVNCDVPAFDGTSVSVSGAPVTYSNVTVFGSDESASFQVLADLDPLADPTEELVGAVEADSCLALFRVWDDDDETYIQCLGTFSRSSQTIPASCDSVEVDLSADGVIDATCDLSAEFDAGVGVQ
jgi:hypothetical protein